MEGSSAIYDVISARLRLKVKDLLLTLKSPTKSVWGLSFGFLLFIWLDFNDLLQVTLGLLWSPRSMLQQVKIASKKLLCLRLVLGMQFVPKL